MKKLFFIFIFGFQIMQSQVCFNQAVNYSAGNSPGNIVSTDFNGDTFFDLAVTNYSTNDVSIFLGDGLGNFGIATSFAVNSVRPINICSADFNNDAKRDLVVINDTTTNNVSLLLGNGLGGFGSVITLTLNTNPNSVTSTDFNGDTFSDLAISGDSLSIMLGDGLGGFGSAVSYITYADHPHSIISADLNADSKADIVTTDYSGNHVVVLLGDGTGGFGPMTAFTVGANPKWPTSVCSADFNNDGKIDLATANTQNTVSVLLGDGVGGFSLPTLFSVVNVARGICAEDFNQDNNTDLAVARGFSNISILLGNGAGSFSSQISFTSGNAPSGIVCSLFDSDTLPDLATGNLSGNNVSVFLNCDAVGISEITEQNNFTVYPNPVNDKIYIEQSNFGNKIIDVVMVDMYGKQLEPKINTKHEIEVSDFPDGVYFVKLRTDGGIGMKKIVIQH